MNPMSRISGFHFDVEHWAPIEGIEPGDIKGCPSDIEQPYILDGNLRWPVRGAGGEKADHFPVGAPVKDRFHGSGLVQVVHNGEKLLFL